MGLNHGLGVTYWVWAMVELFFSMVSFTTIPLRLAAGFCPYFFLKNVKDFKKKQGSQGLTE